MKILAFVSLSLILAGPLSAQHWNAEEQALVDHIKTCWDAWVETRPQPDPDRFFEQCPYAEDASRWWTNASVPQTKESIIRNWINPPVDIGWVDLTPIAIRIWDDVAMVQMYGSWKARTPNGPVTTEFKRTEVFRKVDGRWMFVGGQGTPTNTKDADPYE